MDRNPLKLLATALLALVAIPLLTSCTSSGPLAQPAQAYVEADRLTFDTVAPEFESYLRADVTLDANKLALWLGLLSDWEARLRSGESVYTDDLPPWRYPPPHLSLDDWGGPPGPTDDGADDDPAAGEGEGD